MRRLRLAIWPPVARVAVLLGAATLLLYVVILHDSEIHSPATLLKAAVGADNDKALRAIKTLGTLANADDAMLSAPARRQMESALTLTAIVQNLPRAAALVRALPRKRTPSVENGLGDVIELPSTDAETRRAALGALESLGTADAVEALRHVFEGGGGERGNMEEVNNLKGAALEAIGRIQNVWALRALVDLQSSQTLADNLKVRAREVAATIDPLVWSKYYLDRSEFDNAIAAAQVSAPKQGDTGHAAQVASVLANIYAMRGLASLERRDYAAATEDLTAAVASGAAPASLTDAVALAHRLGFQLHETEALQDPQAYEESYRAFKSIQPINRSFGDKFAMDADANLAESALTSGHVDEALRLARDAGRRARLRPDSAGTAMATGIIEAAALALKRDDPGARKALDNLRGLTGSPTGWRYDGTAHYLASAPVSEAMRHALLAEIRRATGGAASR